jgi:hypothetical protein
VLEEVEIALILVEQQVVLVAVAKVLQQDLIIQMQHHFLELQILEAVAAEAHKEHFLINLMVAKAVQV